MSPKLRFAALVAAVLGVLLWLGFAPSVPAYIAAAVVLGAASWTAARWLSARESEHATGTQSDEFKPPPSVQWPQV